MRVCDICKSNNIYSNKRAVVDNQGRTQTLELCRKCYDELGHREDKHGFQAYEETVKAMAGEIPRKFHWWNKISW